MSNPLKKTMVFLGLAEEELGEDGTPESPRSSAGPASSESAPQSVPRERSTPQKAPVTPLRKVTPTRQAGVQSMNEILTLHPTEYRDVAVVAENFRDGVPVILNLSKVNEDDAKRIIDFASGLSMGLRGRIERVTSKVFLLSPEHIAVSGDESLTEESGSFFVSPSA
ncbi:MAG: cell division protein SepF [Leucobacter sp.]